MKNLLYILLFLPTFSLGQYIGVIDQSKLLWQNYDSRLNVAFDYLYIDRDNDYPSDNAIHPSASGYKHIGIGTGNLINHIYQ